MKPNESRLIAAAAAEAAVAEISSNCCCFFGEREILDESTWFLIDNSFVFDIFKKAIIVLWRARRVTDERTDKRLELQLEICWYFLAPAGGLASGRF